MKIAALIDDLFFSSKISAIAAHVGAEVVFCRSVESVPADADRILVDLNATGFDAVAAIRSLKATRSTPVTAYLSHVQVNMKQEAEAAGADDVIPRSTFVQRLPELLAGN